MINVQTLGALLRALQASEASPLAVLPTPRVPRVAAIAPVASEGIEAESARSTTADTGRQFAAGDASLLAKGAQTPFAPATGSAAATAETAAKNPAAIVALGHPPAAAGGSTANRPPSTSLQLSGAAQWLGELRQTVRPGADALAAIRPAQSLVAGPPVQSDELALALRQSIARSGLFYEAHLADWVLQKYPQADLQREPQAALPPAVPAAAPLGSPLAANTLAPSPQSGDVALPPSAIALPDVAAPLVRDQLETLETRQLVWNGAAWPGQQVTIAIREDESGDEVAALAAWRTHLTVELPHLGRVVAELVLRGTALQITLRLTEAAQATISSAALGALAETLQARSFDATVVSLGHGLAN